MQISYTPADGFYGSDSFSYTANGPGGASSPATVTVNVTPLAVPVIVNQTATVVSGQAVTISAINGASGAPYTALTVTSPPSSGTAAVSGTDIIYTAPAGFTGKVTIGFTVANAFGTSLPATAEVTVAKMPLTAPMILLNMIANSSGTVDVTKGATGGPFTKAAIVAISPSSAGLAQVLQTPDPSGAGSEFSIKFTAARHYAGKVVLSYTISNALVTSAPGTITFEVVARTDPTQDADVQGLITAQIETALRFPRVQIANFNQRLESLHRPGPGAYHNGLTFQLSGDNPGASNPVQNPYFGLTSVAEPLFASDRGWIGYDRPGQGLNDPAAHRGQRAPLDPQEGARVGNEKATNGGAHTDQSNFAAWVSGSIDFGLNRQAANRSKLKFSTSGITVGSDYRVSDQLILGAGIGYGQDTTKIGTTGTRHSATNYVGAVYGSYHPSDKTFIDAVLGVSRLSYETLRFYVPLKEYRQGERRGNELFGSITGSWEFRGERSVLTPYGRLDAVVGQLNRYTEVGGIGALTFAEQDVRSLSSTLGVRGDYVYLVGKGILQPAFRIEYQRELQGAGTYGLQYADWLDEPNYIGHVSRTGRENIMFGVGADYWSEDMSLSLHLKTNATNSSGSTYQIMGKSAWRF